MTIAMEEVVKVDRQGAAGASRAYEGERRARGGRVPSAPEWKRELPL